MSACRGCTNRDRILTQRADQLLSTQLELSTVQHQLCHAKGEVEVLKRIVMDAMNAAKEGDMYAVVHILSGAPMVGLPGHVMVGPQQAYAVREVDQVPGDAMALGMLDGTEGCIWIKRDQPLIGKHIVLFHELLHATEQSLADDGLCPPLTEAQVTLIAGGLWARLAYSGLLRAEFPHEELTEMFTTKEPKA